MRIAADGKVGVGMTPVANYGILQVGSAVTSALGVGGLQAYISGTNSALGQNGNVSIVTTDGQAANIGGSIGFGGKFVAAGTSAVFASVSGRKENGTDNNGAGYLQFSTEPNGGVTTERMRITSTGRVGIGTTAPTAKLEVSGEIVAKSGANWNFSVLDLIRTSTNTTTPRMLGMMLDGDSASNTTVGAFNSIWGFYSSNPGSGSTSADLAGQMVYGAHSGHQFYTNGTARMTIAAGSAGTVNVVGTFTAGTKTFRIAHPLPAKNDTHYLLHSSIEGPQADLIYRGRADLVSGTVDVNIDTAAGMTEGTFEVLCADVQCFTSNEDGWTALKGAVTGNVLTITAQDNTCTDTVSWMVIGERKDAKMIESEWADNDGKLIVETLKSEHELQH